MHFFLAYRWNSPLQERVINVLTRSLAEEAGTTAFSEAGAPEELLSGPSSLWKLNFSLSDLPREAGMEERGDHLLGRNENTRGRNLASPHMQLLLPQDDLNASFWVVTFSQLLETWSFYFHLKLCAEEK